MKQLFFLVALLLLSCQNQSPKEKKALPKKDQWQMLKMKVDGQLIWISNDQDTCFYREKKINDSIISGKFIIPKRERDSIFALAKEAIINYKVSDKYYTCYAGQYVSLILEAPNGFISCNYSSIPDWTKVSSTLKKLSNMTFDRYKIPLLPRD